MSNRKDCKSITMILNETHGTKFGELFSSNCVWYVDQVVAAKSKRMIHHVNLRYSIMHYLCSAMFLSYLTFDSFVRLVFKKKSGAKSMNQYNFIYFANSHKQVLSKIKEHYSKKNKGTGFISARTIREVLSGKKDESVTYIDEEVSFYTIVQQLKQQLIYMLFGRKSYVQFINILDKSPSLRIQLRLTLKIHQSIRFKIWTDQYYDDKQIDCTFLGNDTCYRSYWLLRHRKCAKSLTVQHGVPDNIVQYFSISDHFLCWDKISFDSIFKNENVQYAIVGYPKDSLLLENDSLDHDILIICTKIKETEEAISLLNLTDILSRIGYRIKIKFHPIEEVSILKLFDPKNILHSELKTNKSLKIVVVDSTFGVDLVLSNQRIIPVTFNLNNAFSQYFKPTHINHLIEKIRRSADLEQLLSSLELTKIDTKMIDLNKIESIVTQGE